MTYAHNGLICLILGTRILTQSPCREKGGENLQQIYDRVVPALFALENELSGDVCLVAHDAVIKVMLCHWLEAPSPASGVSKSATVVYPS